MPDVREVYEMVTKQKPSDPGALERQRTRQVRAMRNRKIGAFALTAAIVVVAIAVIIAMRDERRRTNVGTDVGPAPEVVATRFMEAYAAFDADRAIAQLADDADVSGLVASIGTTDGGTDGLRAAIAWLEAVGFAPTLESCEVTSTVLSGTNVRCTFVQHLLRSDEIGLGPYGPSYIDFVVRDGRIVRIPGMYFNYGEGFSSEVWEPFAEWVLSTHPGDAAVMYADDSYNLARLSEGSIRLWERHTKAWANEVDA